MYTSAGVRIQRWLNIDKCQREYTKTVNNDYLWRARLVMVMVERAFHGLFSKLWSCLSKNTPYSVLRWEISPCRKCPSCLATHVALIMIIHLHSKSLGSLRLVCEKGIPTRSISLKPKVHSLCERLARLSPWLKHWMVLSILFPQFYKQPHTCVRV